MTSDDRPIKNPESFGPIAKMALEYLNDYVEYVRYELDCSNIITQARTMQLIMILNTLQEELIAKMIKHNDIDNLPESRFIEDGDTCMAINILNQRIDEIKNELGSAVYASRIVIEIGKSFLLDDKNISELEVLKIKKSYK